MGVIPSREQGLAIHERHVAGDPTASADLFETHYEALVDRLRFKWPNTDEDDLRGQAVESIANYLDWPQRYDPTRSALLTWLAMDAHGDLANRYALSLIHI